MLTNKRKDVLVELQIHAVAGTDDDHDQSLVLLKESKGERILPIMVSRKRSLLLMMRANLSVQLPVATTPVDAAILLMQQFGIQITRVVLTGIQKGVFLCKVCAQREGVEKELNYCMAADGIVLAATVQSPILIEEELLQAQYMRKTGENSFAMNISTLTKQMLEKALQQAVNLENYEAASRLRDELAKRQ